MRPLDNCRGPAVILKRGCRAETRSVRHDRKNVSELVMGDLVAFTTKSTERTWLKYLERIGMERSR